MKLTKNNYNFRTRLEPKLPKSAGKYSSTDITAVTAISEAKLTINWQIVNCGRALCAELYRTATSLPLLSTTRLPHRRFSRNSPSHHQYCSEFHENAVNVWHYVTTCVIIPAPSCLCDPEGRVAAKERLEFRLPLAYLNILLKVQSVNLKPTLRLPVELH
jgi:hypothetical protein